MFGSIMNTVIGAGIKVGANLINFWLEQKKQDQMMIAARDAETLKALLENQDKRADDPFVKVTRRILFMSITFTMCLLMPKGDNAKYGLFAWIFGGESWTQVKLTGGLMLASFMDLCFMVIGFYAIPSKK